MPEQVFNINVEDNFPDATRRAAELEAELNKLIASGMSVDQAMRTAGVGGTVGGIATGLNQTAAASVEAQATLSQLNPTLGLLGANLSSAKKEFDGSPASVIRLSNAQREYSAMAKQASGVTDEFTQAQNKGINVGNLFERQIIRIAIGFAVWRGIGAIVQEINNVIKAEQDYSLETARFAAITDQSIGSATAQWNSLRAATTGAGFLPSQSGQGILQAGRFFKNPEEQQQLVTAGAQFAEIIGAKDPNKAIEQLGQVLKVMNAPASESAHILDFLTDAFKRSGASADDFLTIINDSVAMSQRLGLSWQQTASIIIAASEKTGQQATVLDQTMTRMSQSFEEAVSGNKLNSVENFFRGVGVDIRDANRQIRTLPDILSELSQRWNSFSAEDRVNILDALFGGQRIRDKAQQAGFALIASFADGMNSAEKSVDNAANTFLGKIDNTFGQINARIKARIEEMRQGGDIAGAAGTEISAGVGAFLGSLLGGAEGGKQALLGVEFSQQIISGKGREARDQFQKRLMGLTPEEANAAIAEWYKVVTSSLATGAQQLHFYGKEYILDLFKISAPAAERSLGDSILTRPQPGAIAPANKYAPTTPSQDMRSQVQQYLDSQGTLNAQPFSSLSNILPKNQIDVTKMTADQINQIKRLSVQLTNEETQAFAAQLQLLGFKKDEIDKILKGRQDEIDKTAILLQMQGKMVVLTGAEAANFNTAMNASKTQAPSVQRLQNIDPSQIPQLVAMIHAYDTMFTKIGAPQQQGTLDLFVGPNNAFKQLIGSNLALQFALEDLTKVQKAQLSGTWNLPSGATAMVPISSLDLQRWNSKGGMSSADIAAMMNALNPHVDATTQAVNQGSINIVNAVYDSLSRQKAALGKDAPPYLDVLMKATQSTGLQMQDMNQIARILSDLALKQKDLASTRDPLRAKSDVQGIVSDIEWLKKLSLVMSNLSIGNTSSAVPIESKIASYMNKYYDMLGRQTVNIDKNDLRQMTDSQKPTDMYASIEAIRLSRSMETISKGYGSGHPLYSPPVNVQVGMLPLRVNTTQTTILTIDGAVVARAIMPYMFQMMARAGISSGAEGSRGRVR